MVRAIRLVNSNPSQSGNLQPAEHCGKNSTPRFVLRLPHEQHTYVNNIAQRNRRSMNAEIHRLLERHISAHSSISNGTLQTTLPEKAHHHDLASKFMNLTLEKKLALLALLK
jgi:hypothetical protein